MFGCAFGVWISFRSQLWSSLCCYGQACTALLSARDASHCCYVRDDNFWRRKNNKTKKRNQIFFYKTPATHRNVDLWDEVSLWKFLTINFYVEDTLLTNTLRILMILAGLYCFQMLQVFAFLHIFSHEYFCLQDRIKHFEFCCCCIAYQIIVMITMPLLSSSKSSCAYPHLHDDNENATLLANIRLYGRYAWTWRMRVSSIKYKGERLSFSGT